MAIIVGTRRVDVIGPFLGAGEVHFDTTNAGDHIWGNEGGDKICAIGGDDNVIGGAGADIIGGGSGHDHLIGGGGNFPGDLSNNVGDLGDLITGGTGDDYIEGNLGNDSLYGGADNDTIRGGEDHDLIAGFTGDDRLSGDDGNDTVGGGAGNDVIRGGAGNDNLGGGAGNDVIGGGAGNDCIDGHEGNDKLAGGAGNDIVQGSAGDDLVRGGAGDDSVSGGVGNDTVSGGVGNDVVAGGSGNNVLSGGTGRDAFVFEQDEVSNNVITDFECDETKDVIVLCGQEDIYGVKKIAEFAHGLDNRVDDIFIRLTNGTSIIVEDAAGCFNIAGNKHLFESVGGTVSLGAGAEVRFQGGALSDAGIQNLIDDGFALFDFINVHLKEDAANLKKFCDFGCDAYRGDNEGPVFCPPEHAEHQYA